MPTNSSLPNRIQPSRDSVLAGVREIVAEYAGHPPEEIREDQRLVEDLGCDSLDVVEISMEVEEHFDVSIPDEFGEQIRTVGDVADGVQRLLHGEGYRGT